MLRLSSEEVKNVNNCHKSLEMLLLRAFSVWLYSSEVSFFFFSEHSQRPFPHTAHRKVKIKIKIGMLSQGTRIIMICYTGLRKCTRNLHSLKKLENKLTTRKRKKKEGRKQNKTKQKKKRKERPQGKTGAAKRNLTTQPHGIAQTKHNREHSPGTQKQNDTQ